MSKERVVERKEKKKGIKALNLYLIFFIVMIAFIAIAPFVAIDSVEKKTHLSPKERIAH